MSENFCDRAYLGASPFHSVATATSIWIRDGKKLLTDGPVAETREQLGGYFLIEVRDLNEAIAIAGRIPGSRKGTVEIRPVLELTCLSKVADKNIEELVDLGRSRSTKE